MASSSDKNEQRKPIYVPRQIDQWKKHQDAIWCDKTNLTRYLEDVDTKVDVVLCNAFIQSHRERDKNEAHPSGVVEGILVQYSPRYLHTYFGWDLLMVISWNASTCRHPEPDWMKFLGDTPEKKPGRYDVFDLAKLHGDPWFSRLRGILSQIFLRNDCHSIAADQLKVILMADAGEKVNWGFILDRYFKYCLEGHRSSKTYQSPIGPFLTKYITRYLEHYRTCNAPPPLGTFSEVQRELSPRTRARQDSPEPSRKRQCVAIVAGRTPRPVVEVDSAWGPRTRDFQERYATMRECMDTLLQFVHSTEQARDNMAEKQSLWERSKRKVAEEIKATKDEAQKTLDAARLELQMQLGEAEQNMANLRIQVANLELELANNKERGDALDKENSIVKARVQTLEILNDQYLARCKDLANEREFAQEGQSSQPQFAMVSEEVARLQAERVKTENANANFEANKVRTIQEAVRVTVTNVYKHLRDMPKATAHPTEEFIDRWCDDAIESLGLQESNFDWDDEDVPLHQILQPESEAKAGIREETPPNTLPAPTTTSMVTPVPVTTPITPGAPSDPQSASTTQSAAQDAAQGVTQGAPKTLPNRRRCLNLRHPSLHRTRYSIPPKLFKSIRLLWHK